MNKIAKLTLSACLFAAMPVLAQAEKYTFSTWLEPNHVITKNGHTRWVDDVRAATNGEVDFELFVGGALLPPKSTLQGVSDGLAQGGVIANDYSPSELPLANAVFDFGHRDPDFFVLAIAYGDFMMNSPRAQEEWARNGVVFGGSHSTPEYNLLCSRDIRTLEDLQGKRARVSGGSYGSFLEAAGITPVAIPSSDIYTALERGAIDCAVADATHLTMGANILEIAKSVVQVPLTPHYNAVMHLYDRDFWQALSPENRRHLFNQSARATARILIEYDQQRISALDAAKQAGVALVEPDEALKKVHADWVNTRMDVAVAEAKNRFGLENPEELRAGFEETVAKWRGLIAGIDRHNEEALTGLIRAELYDKIDTATYSVD